MSRRLLTDAGYTPALTEWNRLLDRIGRAYKAELSRRTMFESELFPLNSYITMGHLEDYLQLPDRIRAVTARARPEDIVTSRLPVGSAYGSCAPTPAISPGRRGSASTSPV